MSDDDLTPRGRTQRRSANAPAQSADTEDVSAQIGALTELVGALSAKVNRLTERLDDFGASDSDDQAAGEARQEDPKQDKPGSWVWFSPPAAAEDRQHRDDDLDPRFTLDNFVAWFNLTFEGRAGSSALPIPDCWREHPGLAMEVATLAYAWRHANVGRSANVRDAQYWHHTWRPGFAVRLLEWVHSRCLDGHHQRVGADPRADRFTTVETETDQSRDQQVPEGGADRDGVSDG